MARRLPRQTGFPFAFHSIWFSLTGVDERLSLAFEIGLEWVVCHKMGLSTTFATTPSTMTKIMKLKPQVEGLSVFGKGGYGRPSRVKRSKWALFLARGQLNVNLRAGTDPVVCKLR